MILKTNMSFLASIYHTKTSHWKAKANQDDDELDEDGLSVEILRQRYEKEVHVDKR